MNYTEKRELKAAIALKLGWQLIGGEWYSPEGDKWVNLPDWLGADWPALAEAMRKRGWMPIVKWVPDNIPNYSTPEPHQMIPRAICEMDWRGHHQRPPRPENALAIRDQLESADTPGEAVALASKSALEAEVS